MQAITLTQGKTVLVDDEDFELVAAHSWYAKRDGHKWYAMRNIRSPKNASGWTSQMMHTVVSGFPYVDHKNGNGLDNRRSNLRHADHQTNGANRPPSRNNRSGFKGVHASGGRWRSRIKVDGRTLHLGSFTDPEEAARVYDAAAQHHFGEFAYLNFAGDS